MPTPELAPEGFIKLIAIELGLRPSATNDEILTELRRLRSMVGPKDDDEAAPDPPAHIALANELAIEPSEAKRRLSDYRVEMLLTETECQAIRDARRLLQADGIEDVAAVLAGIIDRLPQDVAIAS